MQNRINISIEHMRVMRIFIKHLHYFSNSAKNKYELGIDTPFQYNSSSGFVSPNLNDPLDEFRKNLWSPKYPLQKNLYIFLRLIFNRWPNDFSFRIPLETWLSFIQPWRYIPGKNNSNEMNQNYDWKSFVVENIFFYTNLFRQVINRISKQLDLNANNSLLIYRVLKVFSQDNIKGWIKEAEINFLNSTDMSMHYNRSNYTLFSSIRHSIHASPG